MTDPMKEHKLTIKRVSITQGAAGGQVRSFSTGNRGSRPNTVYGRAIRMKESEKIEHGVRGDFVGWKFLVPDVDPQVELEDQIVFEYYTGESHTIKVTKESFVRSTEIGVLYKFLGEEDSTES